MWKWLEKVIGTSEQPLILTKEVKPKYYKTYKIKGKTYYLRKTKKKDKK